MEWSDSMTNGVLSEHEYVVRQLKTRKEDNNLTLVSRPIDEASNALARYLARYGAENFDRMMLFDQPFGRVRELWQNDTGLGPVGDQFVPVLIEDLDDAVVNEVHGVDEPVVGVDNAIDDDEA